MKCVYLHESKIIRWFLSVLFCVAARIGCVEYAVRILAIRVVVT
jgi:hypothetical protein